MLSARNCEFVSFPFLISFLCLVLAQPFLRHVLTPFVCRVYFHAQEAARQLQHSLAVHTRKRSSRLLVIEQDRAAVEAEKQRRQEIEEAHSREIRQMKREQIRAQREMEREKRAKEREERLKPKEVHIFSIMD